MAIILKTTLKTTLNSETETQQFAKTLAQNSNPPLVIYLQGDLGVGKTTFARSFIQFFGFDKVKSPTYSLVESYQNDIINIHHFDCYRLSNPEELEYIGIREYLKGNHIQLIEWPDLGKGIIAPADLTIEISGDNNMRKLTLDAQTNMGEELLKCIN
ncbi:MAG: tRNA threonylcarbamoyladenosine biosynthesis protein TsaE [Catillopecten margaritatus gill symbiont]|uniref:tRNA threonylcarbamoyladenosine biosynthesis protein TsaE n=1 Tax=Catillopecten margaritatus gill symbiont TaxID=3083288 RepID=A0AAU6PHQ1_9GAMM